MRIELHRYKWKMFPVVVFHVEQWRPIYWYFNMVFGRASSPLEMVITDLEQQSNDACR